MQIQVGIIGCGAIAKYHVEGLRKNGVAVRALADTSMDAMQAFSAPDVRLFSDPMSLLDSGCVNAIIVCTPPSSHEAIAVAALQRGISVLCEKPLAHTIAAGKAIAAAMRASTGIFMLGFRHRFIPAIARIKALLDAEVIGPVVFLNNIFCGPSFNMAGRWFSDKAISGGGVLMDTSSHSIDLFRFLAGEIVAQTAQTNTALEKMAVEDTSVLSVKSRQGAIGALSASWVSGVGVAMIDIIGQKGRIVFDYKKPETISLWQADRPDIESIGVAASLGFAEELAAFFAAITAGGPSPCPAVEGLRALEVIHAALENK